ncbi:MAG: glycosyltransferase family 9 protein [Desulfobulbaceae bacterium]|jgi:ADP-heptose:LPS heptosyltransferase|nr:glycosyltransferase family 9 protein [Desulfobulbaceae bacterium]
MTGQSEHILVIKLGALGDIIMADGALRDIRRHHPGARITVMTTPSYSALFQRCPWVDDVFLHARDSRFRLDKMLNLRRRLRSLPHIDRVYDLQQVGRTRFYCRWLFPRVDWCGDAHGCRWQIDHFDGSCFLEHIQRSLFLAGLETPCAMTGDVSWITAAPPVIERIMNARGLRPGFALLFPGCSPEHPEKRWPHFPRLARELTRRGWQVATAPGPDEMQSRQETIGIPLTKDGKALDIFELAGALTQAALVIGNDTGPTYLAARLGRPGLALFGGHAPASRSGIQYTAAFQWLERRDLADISLDEVIKALEQRLTSPPSVSQNLRGGTHSDAIF